MRVHISAEDNLEVWRLFHKYNALLNVLAYINQHTDKYTDFMEQKIEEAAELYVELEMAKTKCKIKYEPKDNSYSTYTFDFEKQELIFGD